VAGWGRTSGCGRRGGRGAGGWACVTDGPHDTSASVDEIRGYTTLDDCAERHGTCPHVRGQRLHPSVLVNPEHLIARPRTWEELRDDVQARTDRQVYPMTGIRREDVGSILSHIGSLDRDAWGRAWSAMARAWIARGEPLEARDPEGAGKLYLMAWRYASFGGWLIAISPAKKASYQLSLEVFRRFGTLQVQPIETVKLSVPSHGPEADIIVYLQLPAGRRPVPVMISIGGLDSCKEYVAERYGPVYMHSGLGYVAADAPHTGEAVVHADERGERIYTPIKGLQALAPVNFL
jgi:hypothetical protein